MNLNQLFQNHCKKNNLEINPNQLNLINELNHFYDLNFNQSFLKKIFSKKNSKSGFYLYGDVGVGKTMILNFFLDQVNERKLRKHFNEFMLNFHDFFHDRKDKNEENIINQFVKDLKSKATLIYFDEFQVTNIVDAMILGKLFEVIFSENIKIIITTNTKLSDLYKDGLQRDQFLPFISIIKNNSIQKELLLKDDYRLKNLTKEQRIFYPLNENTLFKINQNFREFTRDKKKEKKKITTKGREFIIDNFYDGVFRIKFKDLCDENLGSEDYINIANITDHIFIEEIPIFNENNSNQQLRFITLVDILYEKKISLTLSLANNLNSLGSSKKHLEIFKRTQSRLFEMTKIL